MPEAVLAVPPNVSPPHTPHSIITWPRHFSWKNVFYPFIISHLQWYFLAWYYARSLAKITPVSCTNSCRKMLKSITERECFFYPVDPDEGKGSLPENSPKNIKDECCQCSLPWRSFGWNFVVRISHWLPLSFPSAADPSCNRTPGGLKWHDIMLQLPMLVALRCRAIHHIMAKNSTSTWSHTLKLKSFDLLLHRNTDRKRSASILTGD